MGDGNTESPAQDEATEEWHAVLLELAWGVIANAGWDDCPKTPGWQEAAVRWRDDYFRWSQQHLSPAGYQSWEQLATGLTRERDALSYEVTELQRALRDAVNVKPLNAKEDGRD